MLTEKILKALSQNETMLVSSSFFRMTLEEHLMPLVSKKNETNAFEKTHEIIDQLESHKDDSETFKKELEKVIKSLD